MQVSEKNRKPSDVSGDKGMPEAEILLRRVASVMLRYGLAVASVCIALTGALLLSHYGFPDVADLLFLFSIAIAVWYAGRGPAILALVLSALANAYFFIEPIYSIAITRSDIPHFVIFVLFALLITTFAAVRHRVEHELLQSRDELAKEVAERTQQASLLDLTHDTIFVRDMNDVITYWNRGAQELYGWMAEEAIGKRAHELLHTTFPLPLDEIRAELLRSGRWDGELIYTRRDGTQVVVASRWALQSDEQGKPIAVLETSNDITDHKRAREALENAQAELAHVTRVATLGEMTASIAHEINQPLGAVVNSASASLRWLEAHKPEEARRSISRVIEESHRASDIIGRIRALVKKAPARKDWLDINETIQEVITLAHSEMLRNGVGLEVQLSNDIPLIFADKIQLQQVILNLMMNAIEAMNGAGEGPRELVVSSKRNDSQGVLVLVQDSGPGLDPEGLDHLFNPFYTTKPHGLGMGLAISRSLIEAHGGRLWASANQPHGAVFRFTLPTGGESPS